MIEFRNYLIFVLYNKNNLKCNNHRSKRKITMNKIKLMKKDLGNMDVNNVVRNIT